MPEFIHDQAGMLSAKPVKIMIVDDHEVVRRGLRSIIEAHPGWQVAGEAGNGREALALAANCKPHVIIMDISMPELNGLETTRQLLKNTPDVHVMILTLHESEQLVREVLACGARGYLLKSDATRHLVAAVEALSEGRTYFTQRVSDLLLAGYLNAGGTARMQGASARLTDRETEIMQLLAEGKSNKEVAAVLGLSVKTVETHRGNIMSKLQLRSFSDMVRYAIRNGIVEG